MPDRMYIPAEVEASIREHVRTAVSRMPEVFDSAEEDEDVVTGHFGALLRRGPVQVVVDNPEARGAWTWSLRYRKLRGRGAGAAEKSTGADGIWEFVLDHGSNGPQRKAALFQAKMAGEGGQRLFAQAVLLSTWREAAFVIEYQHDTVFALTIDTVFESRGAAIPPTSRLPFDEFLVDEFVACKVGDREVVYDAKSRRLFWRDIDEQIVVAPFSVRHRFALNVKPPWYFDPALPQPNIELKPEEIHLHRMFAHPHDILGVTQGATPVELKKAKRRTAQLYHPDKFGLFDQQLKATMNRRMAEANAAFDELSGKNRPKR